MVKFACPCCGCMTFEFTEVFDKTHTGPEISNKYLKGGSFEHFEICGWEDDGQIKNDDYFDTGCQALLSVSQENYRKYGAKFERLAHLMRKPTKDDFTWAHLKG